ncbi:MAG: hypothetical protein O2909_00545 [Chloroflexi bacterium]|nr:hypothetical protein [Chloroflexota bacterium]MDA1217917.1 hypothetical protein [Chloroflexota bacterium]PKB57801.1 MAG: hypothetical protein BZY73_01265 [SAR202 cluster bacterium Casp-Chloro-G3]
MPRKFGLIWGIRGNIAGTFLNSQYLYRFTFLFLVLVIIMLIACSSEGGTPVTNDELQATIAGPAGQPNSSPSAETSGSVQSPYQGQETRKIKALSQDDIDGLLNGSGTPFGGIAKPAELNGYPGPRHVLDAVASGEFQVTPEQLAQIESLYDGMQSEAIELGQTIIGAEESIDTAFSSGTITEESLKDKIALSAKLYGQLRIVHLKTHLSMIDILNLEQVAHYNVLRGYSSGGDPCAEVPPGDHDAALWKKHNNCP